MNARDELAQYVTMGTITQAQADALVEMEGRYIAMGIYSPVAIPVCRMVAQDQLRRFLETFDGIKAQ